MLKGIDTVMDEITDNFNKQEAFKLSIDLQKLNV